MSNVAKAKAGYQNYKRSSMRNLHEDEDGNTRYMHIAPTYDQDIIITKAGE